MKSFISIRSAAIAAAVLGSFAAMSSAHARSDVQFSIALGNPGVYVQPAPVYVQPAPVYQPQTVYVQPQSYYGSQPYYVQSQPVYVQRHGRHHGRFDPRADWDRDGVPNRFDRAPTNPYYR